MGNLKYILTMKSFFPLLVCLIFTSVQGFCSAPLGVARFSAVQAPSITMMAKGHSHKTSAAMSKRFRKTGSRKLAGKSHINEKYSGTWTSSKRGSVVVHEADHD